MSDQTATPARAASSASALPARVAAWVRTHRAQAAGGAAVVAVTGLALVRRSQGAGDGSGGDSGVPGGSGITAGLSGTPDTGSTDTAIAWQDQFNALRDELDQRLSDPKPPTPTPTPVPVGDTIGPYTIRAGDTLGKIAQRVYGSQDAWALYELKHANPALMTFTASDPLTFFTNKTLKVWRANPRERAKTTAPTKPARVSKPPVKKPGLIHRKPASR